MVERSYVVPYRYSFGEADQQIIRPAGSRFSDHRLMLSKKPQKKAALFPNGGAWTSLAHEAIQSDTHPYRLMTPKL